MDQALSMKAWSILLACSCVYSQVMQQSVVLGPVPTTSGPSNITLIQTAACQGSPSYSCTISSATANHLLVAVESDDATSPIAPTTPSGFSSACSLVTSGQGRRTYFYKVAAGGETSVAFVAASGASSSVVSEWSGTATSSPFDACVSAEFSASPGTATAMMGSKTVTGAQTDLAIGAVAQRTSSGSTASYTGNWTLLKDSPQTGDGDDLSTGYIINGVRGQFTFAATTANTSHSNFTSLALFKSAVAGSAPGGSSPTFYVDFETSTTGTTLTDAILNSSTHGSCTWATTGTYTGMAISTTQTTNNLNVVTVNGVTYPITGATRSVAMDMSQVTHPAAQCDYSYNVATTVSGGFWMRTPTNTAQQMGVGISYSGTESMGMNLVAGVFTFEQSNGTDWTAGGWTLSDDSWYWITWQYVSGGTITGAVYDSTGTQIGSNKTNAAGGANTPSKFVFGRPGAEGGAVSDFIYFRGIKIDFGGTFPLLP